MPVHARDLIRSAIVSALDGNTDAGNRVFGTEAQAVENLEDGPSLVVWIQTDRAAFRDKRQPEWKGR